MFGVLLCVVIILIYYNLNKNKHYWSKRNVVQFDGLLWKFIISKRSLAELYKEVYDSYPSEKHIGMFMGSKPAVLLKDLDDIRFVLQGDIQNFCSRGIVSNPNEILTDNILFINHYPRWKLLRQKLTTVFTQRKLKNMFYVMERCGRDFVKFIEGNAEIKSKPFIALYTYTTASIGASIFGIDTQSHNVMDCPFMDMAWEIFQPSLLENAKAVLANYSPMLFRLLNLKTFEKFEKFFVGVIKDVLDSRRKSNETKHDFIATCLELQRAGVMQDNTTGYKIEATDEILAAQAFFFFIAGADPSATTMNYSLLELSYNPAILQRVHEEIDEVFNASNDTLSYEDIDKLVYLDMVINESMRKYPSVAAIQRMCLNSTVLPSGLGIESDTITVIPIFAIHRDGKYYPEPDLYEPERFSPDNVLNLDKNVFMPFGGGNRACIGARLARLQVKVGLALLLRRFTLRGQCRQQLHFVPSFFGLRDVTATYELMLRN